MHGFRKGVLNPCILCFLIQVMGIDHQEHRRHQHTRSHTRMDIASQLLRIWPRFMVFHICVLCSFFPLCMSTFGVVWKWTFVNVLTLNIFNISYPSYMQLSLLANASNDIKGTMYTLLNTNFANKGGTKIKRTLGDIYMQAGIANIYEFMNCKYSRRSFFCA